METAKIYTRCIEQKRFAENVFEKNTIQKANRNFNSKIYVRHVIDVLRKQI